MLGKYARVRITDPIGSTGTDGKTYPLNFGTVIGKGNQTAFVMGIDHPVKNFDGRVIATLYNRKGKRIWIVAPKSSRYIINDITKHIDLKKRFRGYRLDCLYESSCGAVVFRDIKGEVRYLLIKNKRSSNWGFPKGHVEPGETKHETAAREVLEETGLHIRFIDGFEMVSKYKIQNRIEKQVSIFVGTTNDTTTKIQKEEIEDYIWLTEDRALSLLRFDNDKEILKGAHAFLNEHNYI